MELKTIKVPFHGNGHQVSYKVETIDVNLPPVNFINVYSVFVDDPELEKLTGKHFTILLNMNQNVMPSFSLTSPGNIEEINLKKTIAQQIMNNPTE